MENERWDTTQSKKEQNCTLAHNCQASVKYIESQDRHNPLDKVGKRSSATVLLQFKNARDRKTGRHSRSD